VVTRLLRRFPAAVILGARQIGKSTLARQAFPGYAYVDLENPVDFARAEADLALLLSQHDRLVIDEAQRLPALFPALRSFLDARPRRRAVLLGSASPGLLHRISESLTGRVGIFELGGISVFEHDADALWINGAFPRLHWSRPRARPAEWYPAYLRTTLEQDIPQLGFRLPAARMRTLLTMVAHGQGSLVNLSELGGSLGLNYHAVAHMLDVFRRGLPRPPAPDVRPGHRPPSFAARHPLLQARAARSPQGRGKLRVLLHRADHAPCPAPRRQCRGVLRGRLVPIEIKLGLTPPDTRSLEVSMRALGLPRGWVVNLTAEPVEIRRGVWMCGLRSLLEELRLRG
jgi:hypothetical protein